MGVLCIDARKFETERDLRVNNFTLMKMDVKTGEVWGGVM